MAVVALIISSCVPAEQGHVPDSVLLEGRELTVKAIMGDVAATKTAIQSDGYSIYWTKSDDINLFYGSSLSGRFTTGINSPSAVADFSGTLASTGVSNSGTPAFWAVYPYNAANSCDGTSVTLTIPEAQEGTAGTFADKLNPSVAKASDTNLSFFNVGSWFIFSVAEEGVVSATLKGNGNEIIAGKVRVTMDVNSRPVAEVIEGEGKQSITMTPANGSSFAVGSYYYFVLLPQSLANGYTLTLTKSDNSSADCVISDERVFGRAQYRMKSSADEGLVYIPEGNIEFADGNVKTICVNHWDTDGDGELSYAEAAAVTSIPYDVFGGNTTITSFDEFRYFTSVTTLYNPFEGCTGLARIEIPSGVTTIGGSAFSGTNLTSIVIPKGVTSLSAGAFVNCPNLASIVVAEGNPNYDSRENCNAIIEKDKYSNTYHTLLVGGTNTTIPASVWYIGSFAFYGRTGLTSIEIPGTVQEMGPGTFTGCTGLTNVIFGSGFSYFSQGYNFQNCTGLTSIEIPSNVTDIGPGEFSGCTGLTSIEIPNSVSTIYDSAFEGCTGLTSIQVNPTTPPSGSRSMFDNTNNAPIYVPASSVNDYKTAEYWRNYADRIKAMGVVSVTGVSFDNATLTLDANTSTTLVPIVAPENATDKTVTWTSSNPDAVTVDQSGTITAQNGGSSMITVTTTDGDYSASCVVTVKPTDVHFNPDYYIIYRKNAVTYFSGDDEYHYESYFLPRSNGQHGINCIEEGYKVEFKFQLNDPNDGTTPYLTSRISYSRGVYPKYTPSLSWPYDSKQVWDDDKERYVTKYIYYDFDLPENGIAASDIITITIDRTTSKTIINGQIVNIAPLWTSDTFFCDYDHDYDEGHAYWYEGTWEGTKLFYIVVRDNNNQIIQEGYADRAVNPKTNQEEHCWCWRAANGDKTYNFAYGNNASMAYEGNVPAGGNQP